MQVCGLNRVGRVCSFYKPFAFTMEAHLSQFHLQTPEMKAAILGFLEQFTSQDKSTTAQNFLREPFSTSPNTFPESFFNITPPVQSTQNSLVNSSPHGFDLAEHVCVTEEGKIIVHCPHNGVQKEPIVVDSKPLPEENLVSTPSVLSSTKVLLASKPLPPKPISPLFSKIKKLNLDFGKYKSEEATVEGNECKQTQEMSSSNNTETHTLQQTSPVVIQETPKLHVLEETVAMEQEDDNRHFLDMTGTDTNVAISEVQDCEVALIPPLPAPNIVILPSTQLEASLLEVSAIQRTTVNQPELLWNEIPATPVQPCDVPLTETMLCLLSKSRQDVPVITAHNSPHELDVVQMDEIAVGSIVKEPNEPLEIEALCWSEGTPEQLVPIPKDSTSRKEAVPENSRKRTQGTRWQMLLTQRIGVLSGISHFYCHYRRPFVQGSIV